MTDDLLTSLNEGLGSVFTVLTNGNIIIGLAVLITLFSKRPWKTQDTEENNNHLLIISKELYIH